MRHDTRALSHLAFRLETQHNSLSPNRHYPPPKLLLPVRGPNLYSHRHRHCCLLEADSHSCRCRPSLPAWGTPHRFFLAVALPAIDTTSLAGPPRRISHRCGPSSPCRYPSPCHHPPCRVITPLAVSSLPSPCHHRPCHVITPLTVLSPPCHSCPPSLLPPSWRRRLTVLLLPFHCTPLVLCTPCALVCHLECDTTST